MSPAPPEEKETIATAGRPLSPEAAESAEEEELSKTLMHPLSPRDPSAGLIRAQGHPIFHLGFFIALRFFVRYDEGPFHCFTQSTDEPGTWIQEDLEDSKQNQTAKQLMWMHLVAFVLQEFSGVFLSDAIMINVHVIKKGLIFFTAPLYILLVCIAEHTLHIQNV